MIDLDDLDSFDDLPRIDVGGADDQPDMGDWYVAGTIVTSEGVRQPIFANDEKYPMHYYVDLPTNPFDESFLFPRPTVWAFPSWEEM
jgi:hypothetical protein